MIKSLLEILTQYYLVWAVLALVIGTALGLIEINWRARRLRHKRVAGDRRKTVRRAADVASIHREAWMQKVFVAGMLVLAAEAALGLWLLVGIIRS
jgi:hypothetical protein